PAPLLLPSFPTRRSSDLAEQLFPGAAADMIETFCDWADRRMEQGAAALDPASPLHHRVRAVIALRLEQNRSYKEAIRRAHPVVRSEEHTSELQSLTKLVC